MSKQATNSFYETENFNALLEIYHYTQKTNEQLQKRLSSVLDENQLLKKLVNNNISCE